VFLLTYRTFLAPAALMDGLVERFNMPDVDVDISDKLLGDTSAQDHLRQHNRCTRLKVLSVLLEWVQQYWQDFALEPDLQTRLQQLLTAVRAAGYTTFVGECEQAVQRQRVKWEADIVSDAAQRPARANSGPLASIMLHLDAETLGKSVDSL
jgi:hypothetical protein